MPRLPIDDEEHQPCRQMAAVLIERTVYDQQIAGRWFHAAAENIKNNPSCANHPSTCACKKALEGWTNADNLETVKQLKSFYEAHYDSEKDEGYLQAVRDLAHQYGISFEQMMERERAEKAEWEAADERAAAKEAAKAERRKGWVYFCYQDVSRDICKYNDGKALHGFYRVVKTDKCYEFTIMECEMQHPEWQEAVLNKEVWRFPLDMPMGVKGTTFENVTPDKIHAT
jgi:hypothetical protein